MRSLSLAILLVACGDSGVTDRRDASPSPDAASDAILRDSGGADVPVDTGVDVGAVSIVGTVRHEMRDFTESGLALPRMVPLANGVVILLNNGAEVERAFTATDGSFSFVTTPAADAVVRLVAADDDPAVEVADHGGAVYAFERAVSGGSVDIEVSEGDFSGALALYATTRSGLLYAEGVNLPSSQTALVRWERGRSTPGGTSYVIGDELWILGGPEDTDEFDTPVVMHELGHFVQHQTDIADSIGPGDGHEGAATYPGLAFREGWASYFSSAARGSALYGDTISGEATFNHQLDALPQSGEYLANPSGGISQTHSEWIVAGALYQIHQTLGESVIFGALIDYVAPLPNDRSTEGRDLVDMLDALMCSPDAATARTPIETIVVDGFRFPYDFNAPCTKPGVRRVWPMRTPPPVALPGRVMEDESGRRLRVITLAPALGRAQDSLQR